MLWFTSDTHFGHANVLNFTDRPFGDIAHMNRALINAINERVAPTDDLYILGDFSYQMTAAEAAALHALVYIGHALRPCQRAEFHRSPVWRYRAYESRAHQRDQRACGAHRRPVHPR